jgi:hypothetical protein
MSEHREGSGNRPDAMRPAGADANAPGGAGEAAGAAGGAGEAGEAGAAGERPAPGAAGAGRDSTAQVAPGAGPLAGIVRGEALRADAEERIRPDPTRVALGWERRFVIEQSRAADLEHLYEASGFETATDPVAPELLADECTDCRLVSQLHYVQLYTRKR